MGKIHKIIISIIITVVAYYVFHFIYILIRYHHSDDFQKYKEYKWVFKEDVWNNLDTTFCFSYVRKRDIYTTIIYKDFIIDIWEFKDFKHLSLNDVSIYPNMNLNNVDFYSYGVLNKDSDPEITVNYKPWADYFNVGLDNQFKQFQTIKGTNYKGFYGEVDRMAYYDKELKPQIIIDYASGLKPVVFLIYEGHNSFYTITITSEKKFDESIINILNLKD